MEEQQAHSASHSGVFLPHSFLLGARSTVLQVFALTEVREELENSEVSTAGAGKEEGPSEGTAKFRIRRKGSLKHLFYTVIIW